ncbi:MAG: hypothetical protein KJ630_19210 [Proteobacteria bacterium]|nr:hypothetical protein [Pseudomonadota bacterium]
MKKKDIAKMLGFTSRQHLEFVLAGSRDFSYEVAKKAVLLFGGDLDTWKLSGNESKRQKLYSEFVRKAKEVVK